MPALVQICIVIVTVGLLAIVWMAVRMVIGFNKATADLSQLTQAVRESAANFDLVTQEARALVALVRDCIPPVQRAVDRFEAVGQRAADLSDVLLAEIELPAFTAVAVSRGVRSGANHLLKRLMHRFTHRNASINGGSDNE
jgi:uncharacterized protein YoxC